MSAFDAATGEWITLLEPTATGGTVWSVIGAVLAAVTAYGCAGDAERVPGFPQESRYDSELCRLPRLM